MREGPEEFKMSILDHLRELRSRVMVVLVTLLVTFVAAFSFAMDIFAWLAAPMIQALDASHGTMAVTQATEGFAVQMRVASLAALFIASPVLFYQIWRFVAPGLYDTEKRWVMPLMAASTTLFLGGAAFAYLVVFKFGFPIFLAMNGPNVQAVLSIESYLSFATTVLVAFGVSFQLPVVVWFLARLGMIDHRDMMRGFRYSVVAIFFIAGVLTPPDVFSQVMMAGPMVLLYAVGIVVARFATTKKREPVEG